MNQHRPTEAEAAYLRDHSSLIEENAPARRLPPPDFTTLLSQLPPSPEDAAKVLFHTISTAAFPESRSESILAPAELDYCCGTFARAIISRVTEEDIDSEEMLYLVRTITYLTRLVIREASHWEFSGVTVREYPQLPEFDPEIHEEYNAGPLLNRFYIEGTETSVAQDILCGRKVEVQSVEDEDKVRQFSKLNKQWLNFIRFTSTLANNTDEPLRSTCLRLGIWAVQGATGTSPDEYHPAKRWPGLARDEAEIWMEVAGDGLKECVGADQWDIWVKSMSGNATETATLGPSLLIETANVEIELI